MVLSCGSSEKRFVSLPFTFIILATRSKTTMCNNSRTFCIAMSTDVCLSQQHVPWGAVMSIVCCMSYVIQMRFTFRVRHATLYRPTIIMAVGKKGKNIASALLPDINFSIYLG